MFGYDWPRFHAAVNDLPAALLFVTVLFDIGAWLSKRESLKAAALWTLWAGVIGGGGAGGGGGARTRARRFGAQALTNAERGRRNAEQQCKVACSDTRPGVPRSAFRLPRLFSRRRLHARHHPTRLQTRPARVGGRAQCAAGARDAGTRDPGAGGEFGSGAVQRARRLRGDLLVRPRTTPPKPPRSRHRRSSRDGQNPL